jgi:hypothetical protein
LDKFRSDYLEVLELLDLLADAVVEQTIIKENLDQILSAFDHLVIGEWLKKIGPQHASASIGEALEIADEAVTFLLCLCIQKDLEREDGLRLDDEEIFEEVPSDFER